jgi:hypothetical protein
MRNPNRWRNIALGFFASGWALAAFLLPGPAAPDWLASSHMEARP